MTVLESERLLLRGWRDEDKAPFAAMNADPRVMEHFPSVWTKAQSDSQADRFAGYLSTYGMTYFVVEEKATGTFLGVTGLLPVRVEVPFAPATEMGWRFNAASWGRGYATEAAHRAIRFGFEERGLGEIVAFTVPDNTRSRALMERLGMTRDPADDFDRPGLPPAFQRHVLYRLKREDWENRL